MTLFIKVSKLVQNEAFLLKENDLKLTNYKLEKCKYNIISLFRAVDKLPWSLLIASTWILVHYSNDNIYI